MNPAQLLEQFDRLADAPDAIPRLRRFILDLAVRGKLVLQDPNDESAAELVKRIQAEKARLINGGIARKEKPFPKLPEDYTPFCLPTNWRWSQLAQIGFINPRNSAADTLAASFIPMTLISAEYGIASKHEVRPWGEIKSGFTHFADGDVALAKITPCFQNGKSMVLRGLTGNIGAGTTELHVVRPVLVDPDYVLIFLKSPHFIASGVPLMTGTAGQKRVATEYFANSPFPLPPVAEQHRIVAKVDELMALCDRLEAAQTERESRRDRLVRASLDLLNQPADGDAFRDHARFHLQQLSRLTTRPEDIRQLRQTILNLAICGKLVRQDPDDEPAQRLIERIQSEQTQQQAEGIYKNSKPLPPIGEADRPFPLPFAWKWFRLRSLVFTLGDGLHGTPDYSEGTDCYFINGNNLVEGRIVIKPDTKTVSLAEMQRHRKLMTLNTVLVSINGTLGNVAYYNNENVVLGKSACYFNLPSLIDKHFVRRVIESPYFANYAIEQATGTTIRNLGLKAMNYFPVPLPPLAEQHRIVAKVNELMALCDRLEGQLTTAQTESRRLLEAVLHEALAPTA